VLAEFLRYLFGAALVTESADGRGNGLADLRGTGLLRLLQRRREQGIGSCRADAEVVPRGRHCGPPRLDISNYIT